MDQHAEIVGKSDSGNRGGKLWKKTIYIRRGNDHGNGTVLLRLVAI